MSTPVTIIDPPEGQDFIYALHPGFGEDNAPFPDPPSAGGVQQVYEGHGAPTITPDDPDLPALYNDLNFPYAQFKWSTEDQAWS